MAIESETETVIKRILPYLDRRGYDISSDVSFELPVKINKPNKGFIDLLIHCGRKNPVFLIEAKRDGTTIAAKHRSQALAYGKGVGVLLAAVTNGHIFELLNVTTGKPLLINDFDADRIPSKEDLLSKVLKQLKENPSRESVTLNSDRSLPYRPGLPLSKLNHLIKQCHNSIRKIEKNEEHAFSDFSKFMFLKLLEEKWDNELSKPPYSFTFHELAATPTGQGDRVKAAIESMINTIRKETPYGAVLLDPIKLKKDASFLTLVKKISSVSFSDCDLDSKGAAFEYFVRATLKGKKLGQYFTPRPLVKLMLHLGRWKQIVSSLHAGEDFKVLDPACGTGGFLVLAMNTCLEEVAKSLKAKSIHSGLADTITKKLKQNVFYGVDAHDGVACSAKMNMIVAGDGHNNIRRADSLNEPLLIPSYKGSSGKRIKDGKAHLILTNPPFGTSEAESLTAESTKMYPIRSTKGQSLFIQKMIMSSRPDSLIVTVIDEGVLNTSTYEPLRRFILKQCRVEMVVSLPDETFKPNKINVRSSVLVLKKRSSEDADLVDDYSVAFVSINSLGYDGSGKEIRGFDLTKLIEGIESIDANSLPSDELINGYEWSAFSSKSSLIRDDKTSRFDYRFWNPEIRQSIKSIESQKNSTTIKEINLIATKRGKSPPAAEYVDQKEGYAIVVKSGSNISKQGELITEGADYIEQPLYQVYEEKGLFLKHGDILLASTGDGTLGKCCVYREKSPAIPEGHVTLIRVDQKVIYPEYVCDYLRVGFGHDQLYRAFTGSTGMIEITPSDVDQVAIPAFPDLKTQKRISDALRKSEKKSIDLIQKSKDVTQSAREEFSNSTS